ncbi:MAG: DUF3108 domain-containing protein [Prevotella sp.]|nr:DUF3108 domain-containing protein [Prevotella sp.]
MIRLKILAVFLAATLAAHAQCPLRNTAIDGEEYITFNLYFNWQFVWVKAGTASLTTTPTTRHGHDAFRTSLITRGNGKADKFFILRDTITAVCTRSLEPLSFRKGAREGDRYTVDDANYNYSNGRLHVKLHRQKNDGTHVCETKSPDACVFDMLNLFQRARSFDLNTWRKGHEEHITVASGVKLVEAILRYKGRETVKGDNGVKYPCLKLEYIEKPDGKEKSVATFFATADKRHIPVRIDINLRFGSAKAFLTNIKTNPTN